MKNYNLTNVDLAWNLCRLSEQ